jgi:hypothetical protein
METLCNIYKNGSQACHSKGKIYRDAQLRELVHSVVVEHAPEHVVTYRRTAEKVKLLLDNSHLDPQAVRPQHHRRDDDLE